MADPLLVGAVVHFPYGGWAGVASRLDKNLQRASTSLWQWSHLPETVMARCSVGGKPLDWLFFFGGRPKSDRAFVPGRVQEFGLGQLISLFECPPLPDVGRHNPDEVAFLWRVFHTGLRVVRDKEGPRPSAYEHLLGDDDS